MRHNGPGKFSVLFGGVVAAVATFGVWASARAEINLEWRPPIQTATVGDVVEVQLYAVSDDPQMDQVLAGIDAIVIWDAEHLRLIGLDETGAVDLLFSGFPIEPFNLNEVFPPQDGDGFYQALAPLGQPVAATSDGTLIVTFRFEALAIDTAAGVAVVQDGGSPITHTVVWDGLIPNNPVTGTLDAAAVTVTGPGDFNGDGDIDVFDAAVFLACTTGPGGVATPDCVSADFDMDGDVDFVDWSVFQLAFTGGG